MGYYADQRGIYRRFIREKENWKNHLERSKEFMLKCVKNKPVKKIAILGSGWLLDVPVENFRDSQYTIHLYDIYHPKPILRKFSAHPNIRFFYADITGGVTVQVYKLTRKNKKTGIKIPLSEIRCPEFTPEENVDFTVSLNILNQLDILIIDYLNNFKIYTNNELSEFRARIQASHIHSLIPGKSCLITDYIENTLNKKSLSTETRSLIHTPLPKGKNRENWKWNFDTQMNYYPNKTTIFDVVGIEL